MDGAESSGTHYISTLKGIDIDLGSNPDWNGVSTGGAIDACSQTAIYSYNQSFVVDNVYVKVAKGYS